MKFCSRKIARLSLAAGALAGVVCHTQAALQDEIQVYTDDMPAQGHYKLNVHTNATPSGKDSPGYDGEIVSSRSLRITPEMSYGFNRDVDLGLYLPLAYTRIDALYVAGFKGRLKWVPIKPTAGQDGFFAGASWEFMHAKSDFLSPNNNLNIRGVFGGHSGRWLFAANPSLKWAMDNDLLGSLNNNTGQFAYSLKLAFAVEQDTRYGLEYYSEMGPWNQPLPYTQQNNRLFAVVDYKNMSLGVGVATTSGADALTLKASFNVPLR